MVSEVGEFEQPRMKNPIHSLRQTLDKEHEERSLLAAREGETLGAVALP